MIKIAGIFSGLSKDFIRYQLLSEGIGEDSPIKPTNKITSAELAAGKVFFGKLNGRIVVIVKGKKGAEYAVIGRNGEGNFTRSNSSYKKIRSLGELHSEMLFKLQELKILSGKESLDRLDWYVADPINIPSKGRNFDRDRAEKQHQEETKPKIDKKLFKQWAKKQMTMVKEDFNKKSKKAIDDFFNTLFTAIDLPQPEKWDDITKENKTKEELDKHFDEYAEQKDKIRETFYAAKEVISNYRNTIGYLENVAQMLRDKSDTMWGERSEVRMEDARELKKYITDALKEKSRW